MTGSCRVVVGVVVSVFMVLGDEWIDTPRHGEKRSWQLAVRGVELG